MNAWLYEGAEPANTPLEGATFVDHNRPPFVEVALHYAPERDVAGPQESVAFEQAVREIQRRQLPSDL